MSVMKMFFIFVFALLFTIVKMGPAKTEEIIGDISLLKRPDNAACNRACDILGYGGGQYECCYKTTASDGTVTYQPQCHCSG
uniref:Uncharacterized protein n=1 Tax=Panagrolaimus sp. ES5 TaxID=591445 RepID=A0AC34GRE0_9BILA